MLDGRLLLSGGLFRPSLSLRVVGPLAFQIESVEQSGTEAVARARAFSIEMATDTVIATGSSAGGRASVGA